MAVELTSRVSLIASLSARAPPFAISAAAHAVEEHALLAALDAFLSARTPPFASAAAAHAAAALASLAALNASFDARAPPFAMAVAAHLATALASLAMLDASISAGTSPFAMAVVADAAAALASLARSMLCSVHAPRPLPWRRPPMRLERFVCSPRSMLYLRTRRPSQWLWQPMRLWRLFRVLCSAHARRRLQSQRQPVLYRLLRLLRSMPCSMHARRPIVTAARMLRLLRLRLSPPPRLLRSMSRSAQARRPLNRRR